MPRFQNWDQGGNSRSGGDSSLFLKLQAGNKYRVRLISRPLHYLQFWEPIVCRSPGQDKDGNVICPLMQQGLTPKDRYAIWVFDRLDDNKLKIMDFPPSLFDCFKEWKEENNEDPGGPRGTDWSVKLEAPSGNQKYVKYKAVPVSAAPFTEEELKRMNDGRLKERILEVRKDDSPEEIRAKLAEVQGGAPARQQPAPSKPRAESTEDDTGGNVPPPAKAAADDDGFSDFNF